MSTTVSAPTPATQAAPKRGLALPIAGACFALVLIAVGLLLATRRDEVLPGVYGKMRGTDGSRSVNGTVVLADLFRRRGHSVTTVSRFSPRLDRCDVIVWAPDDFNPPDEKHRDYLENWLKGGYQRTVIYVGRDYNAAIDYWERMAPSAPAEQASESLRRQAEARSRWEASRSQMPNDEFARWFVSRRDKPRHRATSFSGPWAAGVDASQTEIHVEGQLAIPTDGDAPSKEELPLPKHFEPLLVADSDPIAFRITNDVASDNPTKDWSSGRIIVLNNGSFVLNYPLVNHEHRKLAEKLIAECGSSPQKIIFVESGSGGPAILDKEPTGDMPSALSLLKVWPLNAILLHVAMLGIILCLSRSPIFGRPRDLPEDSPSDFGKHVTALGKLLAASKDRNYAHARLAHYRQFAARRSGRSHVKTK